MWLLYEVQFRLFHVRWHMSVTGGNSQIEKKPASCSLMPPEGLKNYSSTFLLDQERSCFYSASIFLQWESALILFHFPRWVPRVHQQRGLAPYGPLKRFVESLGFLQGAIMCYWLCDLSGMVEPSRSQDNMAKHRKVAFCPGWILSMSL